MEILLLAGAVCTLLLTYLYRRLSRGPGRSLGRGCKLPPVEGGWVPWLGCALAFGKEPLSHIKKTHDKLGDVFTINVAGKWMTFVMDVNSYQHFFSSNCLDFQAAVLPICKGVAGISPSSFSAHHTHIHDALKGRLSASTGTLCHALSTEFHSSLGCHGDAGEVELMAFVRDAMFESVVRQLFGADNVPSNKKDMEAMMHTFVKYDQDFEYGADLPEIFVKDWRDCRNMLLKRFKAMLECVGGGGEGGEGGEVLKMLLDIVDKENAHNYSLLLLWASQSNAIPAVFWTICHILSDSDCRRRACEEVKGLSLHTPGSEFKPVQEEDLKKFPFIKRCVLEAIRLHAPGMIVRKVVKTHNIQGFTIPEGHLMMISPYWSHRNTTFFPQPERFMPDRWLDCDLEKKQFLPGFVGFGGGRYQCPGKWFALMEMHLFVTMAMSMFRLELKDPMPQTSPLHLVGTQHPVTSCKVAFTRT